MKVGLVDVDSKNNTGNLALMKISAYHKEKGHELEFYNPMFQYDKIYMSKIFSFTDDYKYPLNADEIIKGGSGYDLYKKLPDKIENIMPDYDLYKQKFAMGFTTRGCIRKCPFCVVPEKEGMIKPVNDIYNFWNGQKQIMIMDNNLTAHNEHYEKILKQLIKEDLEVNFSQGLDIRLINKWKAKLLSKIRLKRNGQIHFAFDDIKFEKQARKGIKTLNNNGIKSYKLTFYVLIGFNSTPEEDLERINILKEYGVNPFVMPYKDINDLDMDKVIKRCGFDNRYKYNQYKKNFARWVNHKAIFKSVEWEDYKKKVIS